jgi:hypothetical protein
MEATAVGNARVPLGDRAPWLGAARDPCRASYPETLRCFHVPRPSRHIRAPYGVSPNSSMSRRGSLGHAPPLRPRLPSGQQRENADRAKGEPPLAW